MVRFGTQPSKASKSVKKRQKVQISSHLQFTIRYVICSAHSVEIAVMLLPNQLRNPVIFSGSDRGAFFKGGGFRSMGKKAGDAGVSLASLGLNAAQQELVKQRVWLFCK